MKIKFLVAVVMLLGILSCQAFCHDDEHFVIEEASRRNLELITAQQAKDIAAKRLDSNNVRFKDVELDNEADDYQNSTGFRPVWQLEAVSNGQEYDFDIDAVTGEILKFKRDD